MKKSKSPFWFYIVALTLPVLLLILLESGLRVFDYGTDYSTFVKLSDRFEDYLFFNPKLPFKYFNDETAVPSVIPDAFLEDKPVNGYRIFVLGGSSAAGFPYPSNVSFPQFLRRHLELIYPQIKFEVINLGVSAVNTIFIRDIIDDVLAQEPDLLLFYAGHNEYYGALGAASNNSPGWLTRFNLHLKEFKTYQLLEEIISSTFSAFSSGEKKSGSKTLMAAMAGEQLVELNSEKYKKGIEQFEENLTYILRESRNKNIDIILGKLASNLQQKPLESILKKESKALEIFNDAEKEFNKENLVIAKKMFVKAKEHDALRFRAPEKINSIIDSLGQKFKFSLIDMRKSLSDSIEGHLTGEEYFADHLHPNIKGYNQMARSFYWAILKGPLSDKKVKLDYLRAEKLLQKDINFTVLDSAYSKINIELLLNSYPFKNNDLLSVIRNIRLEDKTDSLAMDIILNKISWENAHLKMAEYFFQRRKFESFYQEMNALIENKPFDDFAYIETVEKLMVNNQLRTAEIALQKMNHRIPGEYSATNLGLIKLREKNFSSAVFYLEKAVEYNPYNPDLYFNLSNAYFFSGNVERALESIKRTLELNPEYPNAKKIFEGLKRTLSSKQ